QRRAGDQVAVVEDRDGAAGGRVAVGGIHVVIERDALADVDGGRQRRRLNASHLLRRFAGFCQRGAAGLEARIAVVHGFQSVGAGGPPRRAPALVPYTTLFRSQRRAGDQVAVVEDRDGAAGGRVAVGGIHVVIERDALADVD